MLSENSNEQDSEYLRKRVSELEQQNEIYRESQRKLTRFRKVLKCLRLINRLIITEKDSGRLIRKTCEYLIKYRNYYNAWIILFGEDGRYETSAEAGLGEKFHLLRANLEKGVVTECCRLAIDSPAVNIVDNTANSCPYCPNKDLHVNKAAMTVRLSYEGRIYGTLTVSIPVEYAGDEEEIEIIADTAADLGFALHTLWAEEKTRLFDYIIKTLPQTFSFLSLDFTYLAVSNIYSKLFNAPLENIIGHKIAEFFDEETFEGKIRPMLERCAAGETVAYDLELNLQTFGTRWMHMCYYPYINGSGSLGGIISHGMDITERKAAESELRKFKTISDNALHGTVLADLQGRLIYINNYFANIHGYTPEELIGEHLAVFHTDNQLADVIEINQRLLIEGSYEMAEVWHKHRDGTVFPMLMSGLVLDDDRGVPAFTAATTIDITGLKKIEKQLIESESKYRYLVETASDIIKQISADGIITEVNEYTCSRLGRRKEELVGQPITVVDPNYSVAAFKDFWADFPINKQRVFETTHQEKGGSVFSVEVHAKKYKVNESTFIMSVARDISDRNRDRKRLVLALERAEEADRLKSAFLANMSHEIRTPLNGVLGFASLMNDPTISPIKQEQYYNIIVKSGKRLLTTINDLIDISRIESGLVEVDLSDISIKELFEDLYQFFSPEVADKNLRFELEIPEECEDAVINSDRDKLYAVMMNLLKNAVKFTKEGSILFGYLCQPDRIEFYVTDTGNGIPKDQIDAVFDRFIQADLSLTKPFEGSGLGLSISSEYVEMLGGKISVESSEGRGSKFSFSLPSRLED
ncbi:MAG: PAS domain S-box protein [Spirochaetales bacterium]|nr:PAS domain S-box protein [Spirochaetales bacterium]